MSSLTLELIAHTNTTYGGAQSISVPLVNHVHKRIERFVYQRSIREQSSPIAYLENKDLDSRANVFFSDKTWTIPANSRKLINIKAPVTVVTSTSYSSQYKDIVATNKTFVDERGRIRPLFWRHDLPEGTVDCQIEIVTRGNRVIVDTGYSIDYDAGRIYTNYRNFFDPDSDSYKLFFAVCTDADGNTFHEMLNPQPVAKEADWEDIDQDTGRLTDEYPLYTVQQTASGYSFYFNKGDTWYIKPQETSLLALRAPAGREPDDFWFMRVTDGDFSANVNEAVHRYYVPEFDRQPFSPEKPIRYSPYQKLLRVNRRVLAATRQNISINPEEGLHMNIFVYDVDNVLVKVLTTDQSVDGLRYSDTDIFYESDKIRSWDNKGGFIALGLNLQRSWTFATTYYYAADDYEYGLVNLNPVTDPSVLDYTFVFYAVPDANTSDRGIHHLKIDQSGIIVETSQGPGINHPNLQLLDENSNFNPNTIIGSRYISDTDVDTFTNLYTAGFSNAYAYAVLGEVTVAQTALIEDQFDLDVRDGYKGATIKPEEFQNAIRANPTILQSYLGFGEDGMEIPQNAAMVVNAPVTLLEGIDGLGGIGVLTQEVIEKWLRNYQPSAMAEVIQYNWVGGRVSLQRDAPVVAGQIPLYAEWNGPENDIVFLRRKTNLDTWVIVQEFVDPAEPPNRLYPWIDTGVVSGEVYQYTVRLRSEAGVDVFFQSTNIIEVRCP